MAKPAALRVSAAVEDKAIRLLASGRVTVLHADADHLAARVDGDHGTYDVRVGSRSSDCSCPSWSRSCSHLLAVRLISGETLRGDAVISKAAALRAVALDAYQEASGGLGFAPDRSVAYAARRLAEARFGIPASTITLGHNGDWGQRATGPSSPRSAPR